MAYTPSFTPETMTRAEIDTSAGPLVLEFGANWCSICQGAQPVIRQALDEHPDVPHVKVEDGPGRALGRSFKVKLWPTLVFLQNGEVKTQIVRPTHSDLKALGDALKQISTPAA